MKPFEIFKKGRHTAMSGATLDFSEDMLRAAVDAYDPAVHEAPIVVGHPKDNAPAYGWVKGLDFADGMIVVNPDQIDPEFAEMVSAGRFKKRSASWYLPDSPNNPKPGTLYLRHVGFLGAMPPAVKGLKDVDFADDEGAVTIEFGDVPRYTWGSLAVIIRGIREWIIGEKGLEVADKVMPSFYIADVEAAARQADNPEPAGPAFTEKDEEDMDIKQLQDQVAALTAENTQLKATSGTAANFAERETQLNTRESALTERENKIARAGVEARVDVAIKAGKALPAQRARLVDFAMGLADGEAVIDFGEGDKAEKVTQREAYLRQIESAPKIVDYTEQARPDGSQVSDNAPDPVKVADRARELIATAEKAGKAISFTEAVAQVSAEYTAE